MAAEPPSQRARVDVELPRRSQQERRGQEHGPPGALEKRFAQRRDADAGKRGEWRRHRR